MNNSGLIEKTNFSDVSDFAIQVIGKFNLDEEGKIRQSLKGRSNENVHMLISLFFKETADLQLILLVHRYKKKAMEQRLDTSHDNTHIYTIERGKN